ncbi:MAG: hypothetical protein PVF83_19145 [Anaerolineales bacterium]|jgi:hypothetical protein
MRYELLMSWRRGALRTILFLTLVLPQMMHLFGYLFDISLLEDTAARFTLWAQSAQIMGTAQAIMATMVVLILLIVFYPIIFAEIIPLDRQYRMRDVLAALPLTSGVYLAGKVFSVWLVVVGCLILSVCINAILSWILNGPYNLSTFLAFVFTGLLPLALFSSLAGLVLAARKPDRRSTISSSVIAVSISFVIFLVLPGLAYYVAAIFREGAAPEKLADPAFLSAIPKYPNPLSLDTFLRIGGVFALMAVMWSITTKWFLSARSFQNDHNS